MKKYLRFSGFILVALVAINFASCKKKAPKEDYSNIQGNYFSIYKCALDEWNNYTGMPFAIIKTTRINKGKYDTSLSNSDTINWAPILLTFFATDISDRKYLGQYNFNQFDDNEDETHNFIYLAKDPDMFTQKLLITIDQKTMKVKGIYIETYKKTVTEERTQKLYYNPLKTIQIQTDVKPMMGEGTYTLQQWDFMR